MFGLSNRDKYEKYLAWFSDQVKDPNNWDDLRRDHDCSNNSQSDWENNTTPLPIGFSEACFRFSDPKKMQKAMSKKLEANHKKYTDMGQYVNGDPRQGKLNPEYLARFENTKKFKEQMAKYMGSTAAASDELYRLAKEAEASGQDLSQLVAIRIEEMQGNHIVAPVETSAETSARHNDNSQPIEDEPKTGFANDLLHLMWKYGVPVDKFISKKTELSVEQANKIGKK